MKDEICKLAMTALSVTGSSPTIPVTFPNEDRAEDPSFLSLGPVIVIVIFLRRGVATWGRDTRRSYGVRKILPV
jgi:hypothetical protein